jgi:molybdopterin-containing oxidoreductase family iron-sulfur binding subunit
MKRRTFLKIAGMGSLAFAAGCSSKPDKTLYSLVQAPEDMVTGQATWYASTCRECPAGCGILAKNREGRVIKLEGNPLHPINQGMLCIRGQAALQKIYNPDRLQTPLLKSATGWRKITFGEATHLLQTRLTAAVQKGPQRVRMVTETVGSPLMQLFTASLAAWDCAPPLVYEPFAYEAQKAANGRVFDRQGLSSLHMEKADLLVSFGADFLETWLSPVEYARKFKAMHRLQAGRKHRFFHISPYQTLTGANADHWIGCHPGSEAAIALGIMRQALQQGRGTGLRRFIYAYLERAVAPFSRERVAELSGMRPENFDLLVAHLLDAKTPLILGTGTGAAGGNALQANMAIDLLNIVLDPELSLFDFASRHRVEIAAGAATALQWFTALKDSPTDLLLLNNVNPVFNLPPDSGILEAIEGQDPFVVSFSNFMDETSQLADLIFPVQLPLETWDMYDGKTGVESILQPTMGQLTPAPGIGDLFLALAPDAHSDHDNYKTYLFEYLRTNGAITSAVDWVNLFQQGGSFREPPPLASAWYVPHTVTDAFISLSEPTRDALTFIAAPSIRFFDGRGANLPWLCEIPDPLTRVAWHTPLLVHPQTLDAQGLKRGDLVKVQSSQGTLEAPVYPTVNVQPNVVVMPIGQGHRAYGRYARDTGINPFELLSPDPDPDVAGIRFSIAPVSVHATGGAVQLAHTDGSPIQYGRKIAMSTTLEALAHPEHGHKEGLTMHTFPLVLPLAEAYDPKRDFYPPHAHDKYRWSMTVDLDRCIGCGACAAACYAENNIGVVGIDRIREGREMAWLSVERYVDPKDRSRVVFLPMMCQHCDNAPCESVCPVYAPHHNKEGMNNQIYNRCIGTRFCSQNCPYKVRRFNWFAWEWPEPLPLQLNPNVTVRAKGVMEKCSFCVQRIKDAHNVAKNNARMIQDGEVTPACVQTCPTEALVFGNLMDPASRVRKMVDDPRAYQVMGYLNTKPGVIYLKKVVQEV